MILRALAVKQPFAGLIANGRKTIEHRTWSTPYRGPILIVASLGRDSDAYLDALRSGAVTEHCTAKGQTLCMVDLVSIAGELGDYEWNLAHPRPVPRQATKGKLNLYAHEAPDDWRRYL